MRQTIVPLTSGMLFGAGLAISGMMDPKRVRGFLDILRDWDPTLAFVMGGAVIVMAVAWLVRARLTRPAFAEAFSLPVTRSIDSRLVAGAGLFGVGWGLSGLCPGPAVGALFVQPLSAGLFVISMVVGMAMHSVLPVVGLRLGRGQ